MFMTKQFKRGMILSVNAVEGIKLHPGPCAYCGKRITIQKLWCSPNCQDRWEKENRKKWITSK